MFIVLPAVPLLLVLLATMPATSQPAAEEWDAGGERHVELTADNAGQAHLVHISPNRLTGFVFHAPLQRGGVVVEERFRSVTVDETAGLVTLPSGALPPGRELILTARFADGEVPGWATFRLVVHPIRAERQVEVYRQSRSANTKAESAASASAFNVPDGIRTRRGKGTYKPCPNRPLANPSGA
jgi:uncharacterized protein (TIGR02268 family)